MTEGALVIVTPARNEACHLPLLIESMRRQTQPPDLWIVVDDGSTDGSSEVLARAARQVPHLRVCSLAERGRRSFPAKVDAFAAGLAMAHEQLRRVAVTPDHGDGLIAYLGCVDADVELPADFFARALRAFAERPELGITGARSADWVRGAWRCESRSDRQVAAATQIFRYEVYEHIGGYQRLPYGGEDTLANVAARAAGWRTEELDGVVVRHLRSRWSGSPADVVRSLVRQGRCDYDVGTLPSYEVLKLARRVTDRPYVLASLVRLAVYLAMLARRPGRHASLESQRQWQAEQRLRMSLLGGRRRSADLGKPAASVAGLPPKPTASRRHAGGAGSIS